MWDDDGGRKWYPGTLGTLNTRTGTYTVRWDDGHVTTGLSPRRALQMRQRYVLSNADPDAAFEPGEAALLDLTRTATPSELCSHLAAFDALPAGELPNTPALRRLLRGAQHGAPHKTRTTVRTDRQTEFHNRVLRHVELPGA